MLGYHLARDTYKRTPKMEVIKNKLLEEIAELQHEKGQVAEALAKLYQRYAQEATGLQIKGYLGGTPASLNVDYTDLLESLIPEITGMFGFEANQKQLGMIKGMIKQKKVRLNELISQKFDEALEKAGKTVLSQVEKEKLR